MKRLALILLVALSLTGCATQTDVDEAYEKGYKLGYNEGFEEAYSEAKNYYDQLYWDAISIMKENDLNFRTMSEKSFSFLHDKLEALGYSSDEVIHKLNYMRSER